MEFIWDDGGRAASGYVGTTGDCVTRAIAIGTGTSYRDVYKSLGELSSMTPRNGVANSIAQEYLVSLGWSYHRVHQSRFDVDQLPSGTLIVNLEDSHRDRAGHYCCVIGSTIYDTWNPTEEDAFRCAGYWRRPDTEHVSTTPIASHQFRRSDEEVTTQKEFDKVLQRLRALDSTACNSGSTEGEKRNALRMMQNLMLRHNLSREDITEDDHVDSMRFTRMACPVNGRRAYAWEKNLAGYLILEIFPMADWYYGTKGHRTLFWFYGPLDDVKNCIALFRELLLTITASAQLQYGGYSRGSGASYAEGYVRGLPRYGSVDSKDDRSINEHEILSESALIHTRTLAVKKAGREWLKHECGVSLVYSRGSGRSQHDPDAADRGQEHGSKHDLAAAGGRKLIGN